LGFQNVAVGRINGVVSLTGLSYKKMYGCFAWTKKGGCNNEVTVRRGSTVPTRQAFWYYVMVWFGSIDLKSHPIAQFRKNCIINHAAMGRARFMVYPWFFFFRLLCEQTQASTRPNFESLNLWCLLAKSCWNINKSHLSREKIKNPALVKNYIFSPEI